jgi:hypothetical protein
MPKVAERKPSHAGTDKRKLLRTLTYEKRHGSPIFYQDYKRVLSGELPSEAVMKSRRVK